VKKLLVLVCAFAFGITPAKAVTNVDISGDIFTKPNFIVSQTYTFQAGDTVNFGTGLLTPFFECFGGACIEQGGGPRVIPWYGSLPSDLNQFYEQQTSNGAITTCPPSVGCSGAPVPRSLLFTLPAGQTMITLLFDAVALSITPPAGALPYQPPAVPLPGAIWLFGSGLFVFGLLRRRTA
jgi:hypothetical protein